MSEEDIDFLISIQDLEQPDFDNACLERENKRLQQENKQLKEQLENDIDRYEDTISYQLGYDSAKALYEKILTELEEWLCGEKIVLYNVDGKVGILRGDIFYKIQELKEKYK